MSNDTKGRIPQDDTIEEVIKGGTCYAFIEEVDSEQDWLQLADYLNQQDLSTLTEVNLPTGILFYHIASAGMDAPAYLITPKKTGEITVTVDGKSSFVPNLKVNGAGQQVSIGDDFYQIKFRVVAGRTYTVTLNKPLNSSGLYNFVARLDVSKNVGGSLISEGDLITTGAALKNGNVYVWGFRGSAQQGNGVKVVACNNAPQKVKSLSNIVQLVGGAYHLLALGENGDVWGWGQNLFGEAGSKETYVSTPQKVISNIVQISAGEYFSAALDNNGKVWAWGHNVFGQLGDGTKRNSKVPVSVNLNNEVARLIGAAYEGCFAVTEEGHVWAWGDNEASGLGIPGPCYGIQKIIPAPVRIPNLDQYANNIIYISGGNGWGEALLDDGTVIGWGLRASLGVGISSTVHSSDKPLVIMKDVKQLFARYVGSFALTNDGKLYTWGQTAGSAFSLIYGNAVTLHPSVNSPVTRIGGGKEHLFYETEDGKLYGIGYNDLYKLNQKALGAPNAKWPGSEIFL